MPKQESDLKEEILGILRSVPDSYVVKVAGNSFQESGLPDIFFTCRRLKGRAVWLELKKPGEKPRKLQYYKLERLANAGACGYVIESTHDVWGVLELLGLRYT